MLACESIRFFSLFAAGPCFAFPAAKSEEKRMLSQARKMSATPGACIKQGLVRRPLCHKVNLPSSAAPFDHEL